MLSNKKEVNNTKGNVITLKSSLLGVLLTISIIGIRAFQPSAQPLESWSTWSWFWMTLPVTYPFVILILLKSLQITIDLIMIVIDCFSHKKGIYRW